MLKPAILLLEILSGVLGFYLAKMPHICFVWHIKALAWILYALDKRRYNDAYANLEFVYQQTLSHEEKHAIIRRCYENFAFVLLESIRVVYLNPQTYAKRFVFIDEHHITDLLAKMVERCLCLRTLAIGKQWLQSCHHAIVCVKWRPLGDLRNLNLSII